MLHSEDPRLHQMEVLFACQFSFLCLHEAARWGILISPRDGEWQGPALPILMCLQIAALERQTPASA